MRAVAMIFWIGIGLAYFVPSLRAGLTPIFSSIGLPIGYGIITLLGLFPIALVGIDRIIVNHRNILTLQKSQQAEFIVFLCMYILLFAIAAFGIVWYGILLYFGILCVICLGLQNLFTDQRIHSRIATVGIIAIVIVPYFV